VVAALALAALLQTPPVSADTLDGPPETATEAAAAEAAASVGARPEYRDPAEDDDVSFRPRLAPSALYSTNRGFGIGGGVGVSNLVGGGSDLAVDLRLQQHFQSVRAALYTGDPYDAPVYGFVSGTASTTNRRRFFGIGPFVARGGDPLLITHDAFDVEARVGAYPLGNSGLFVQPGLRFLYDYSGQISEASEGALTDLDATSQAAVTSVLGDDRYGLSAGLEVASDLRDWRPYPRAGTFASASARRFYALDGSGLRFNRYSLSGVGYLPIRGRTTIILQGFAAVTRSDDGDDGQPQTIPFYYLPVLDDRIATAYQQDRLTGRDVLAGGLGIRVPIRDFLGVYGIDALAIGFLGNAYQDVFDQFTPKVSFDPEAVPTAEGRALLRPALGLGLGIVNLDKERVVVGGLVGFAPGGFTVATVRVAYDLRDARPLFR
jgi:hypothetical protein